MWAAKVGRDVGGGDRQNRCLTIPLNRNEVKLSVRCQGCLRPVSGIDYEAVLVSSGFEHLRGEEVPKFSQTKVII
ncbi:MAG: hypothetical protein HC769_36715 [Cyanobacteria bacterium CRU_2_1]|nr:hypothetical protein [Cyanobacteria bacterium CRU_2_1]